jgi:choline kinase
MSVATGGHGATATRAVLLAAGRGKRLGRELPKVLLSIAGASLLERHVAALEAVGVRELTVVVGFRQDALRAAIDRLDTKLAITVIDNPAFERGSIVSLHTAREVLLRAAEPGAGATLFMDADVLYPSELLGRLVRSAHASAVLLDAGSEESGEEMTLGVFEGRVRAIARRVTVGDGTLRARPGMHPEGDEASWQLVGESVGFAKVSGEGARALVAMLDEEVSAGRLDQEYEAALSRAFGLAPFGFERVDDLEWTEIDFEDDVKKAELIAASAGG